MKFNTYGNRGGKAVLLIHTLFTNSDFFAPVTEKLSKKYFVIVPTLSGHYENSTYVSTADEIRQIEEFLIENGIENVYAVCGFSLGGNIAYEFFSRNSEMVEKAVIDSAPLFNFPKFIRKRFLKKYARCLRKIKSGNCDVARELNRHFNGMGEYQKDVAPAVSEENLARLVESCFKTAVHKLPACERKKVTFIYGSKDISRLCKVRLKNYRIYKMKGYSHCGFYREAPDKWVERFIEN